MDSSKKFENPSPEVNAHFCNRLFYCWVLPFFKFGYRRDLDVKDIYNSVEEDLSGPLGDALEQNWQKACKKAKDGKPKLQPVIFKTFWKAYFVYGFFLFLQSVIIKMFLPIVLARYIKFYEKSCETRPLLWGWSLGAGVVGLSFLNIVIMHYCQMGISRVGMRVRIAACSVIYRKLLKLNQASLGQTAAGKLVNLLSNDVIRFDMASWFLHYFWITPIQCAVALWIMYIYVGIAALPAMAAICLQAVLLQGYLSKLQGRFRLKIAQLTDNRVKIMSEITSGIQVIKMYAWERPFDKVVELARRAEIKVVTQTSYIKGFSLALMVVTDRATLFIAVLTYVLLGHNITGEVVFSVAQLISTVQLYVSIFLPLAFSTYEEMKVSISRIEEFLYLEENKEVIQNKEHINSDGSIKMVKANASWLANPIVGTLVDIDLELKPGTLCCIIGPVGSGKSSLLQVFLKELPVTRGILEVNGNVSYASQEPWLFVSNVRQNILFGASFYKARYKDVVRACALERDFQQLSHGDKTLVGEKGTALSGGQRARVALARAVYREADIYLLDDPLSAVDAHVANHLFKGCIQGFLKGKTRILVTHQVQFLKGADLIIVMNNGRIEKMGTYNELSEKALSNLSKEIEQQQVQEPEPKKEPIPEIEIKKDTNFLQSISSVASSIFGEEPEENDELIEKGALAGNTYKEYLKAGASIFVLLTLLFLLIIAQVACNATDMWVTHWTNSVSKNTAKLYCQASTNSTFSNNSALTDQVVMTTTTNLNLSSDDLVEKIVQLTTTPSTLVNISAIDSNLNITDVPHGDNILSRETFIYVYFALIVISIILTTARSTLFMKVCMQASTGLHNKMFTNILKAPMRFFDTNPSGRILNRFSKDIGTVDEMLPKCLLETLQIFFVMIGILGLVFIVSPWMIVPALVLGGLFWYGRNVYLSSAQDIKRLEGTTRAPVFSHVSASLYGLSTIRAFGAEDMVIKEFDVLQDTHTGTWVLFAMISESLGFYLDVISTAFLALVTFQFLVVGDEDTLSGDVGLVISQSLILTGMLQYGVRQSAEVASNMTSVERVLQYTRLDEEGPWEPLPVDRPPIGWPSQGCLVFRHAFLRYASEAPPALRNLNIEIKAGEKVGVVGRTGAGKSSLVAALFRLAPVDGKVELDGQETGKVGLRNLRSSISIIPQTPTLFSATMRYNLDPFGYSTDDVLWQALDRVELRSAVSTLEMPVSEGGSNFSAGQRQLICLARSIVRNNKVLVMDEATANVDPATDGLIQKTIREAFKDCTVITVAHRLNTIMDADKVLVMEFGQGVEFAAPYELFQNPNSYFAKMVKETGPNMESKLRTIAGQSFKKRQEKIKELDDKRRKEIKPKDVDKSENTETNKPNKNSEPNITNSESTEPNIIVNGHQEEPSQNHVNT